MGRAGRDAIAGRSEDELALFDFHNRARDAGIAVLYTARVTPDALPLALPDLRSRLSQCPRIALSRLDDDGRREVLRLRARRRGLAIADAAIRAEEGRGGERECIQGQTRGWAELE